jgi:hypothetical protein
MMLSAANGGGTKNEARLGSRCSYRFFYSVENRYSMDGLAALSRDNATNDISAIFQHIFGMELCHPAGDPLNDNARFTVYKNTHFKLP